MHFVTLTCTCLPHYTRENSISPLIRGNIVFSIEFPEGDGLGVEWVCPDTLVSLVTSLHHLLVGGLEGLPCHRLTRQCLAYNHDGVTRALRFIELNHLVHGEGSRLKTHLIEDIFDRLIQLKKQERSAMIYAQKALV